VLTYENNNNKKIPIKPIMPKFFELIFKKLLKKIPYPKIDNEIK
tara:strand:- start:276 stop:407 length:132 start_codon:yes stop_codon:yes gene_type:complete